MKALPNTVVVVAAPCCFLLSVPFSLPLSSRTSVICGTLMAWCWFELQESSGAYNPQVEAISPTLPNDEARDVIKQSKEELLTSINRADREIGIVEQNLKKLQAKQVRT